jgi:O-antigen/teichoic acid export membrane protein
MSLAQIALGLVNFTALGLIFGYIFGFLAGLSRLIYFWFKNGFHLIKNVTFSSLLKAGKDHKDLPLYSNWGGLVNVIGLQLPVILFASFFSPYLAGFYMLSQRVANAPVQLVAESVGKVFYIAAIKQTRDKRLPSLVKAAFTILIRISLLPFIVLTIISPELFIVIFGNEWAEAGVYLQLMAVWLLSSFIFVPLMTLFAALNKHKADLVFQIALVTARLVGIYIGATLNSPLLSIAAFSIFSALIYIIFGSWLLKLAGINYLDQIKIFLQECRIPFILSFILYIYKFFLLDNQMIAINIFGFWSFIFLSFIFISIYLIRSKSLLLDLKKFSN